MLQAQQTPKSHTDIIISVQWEDKIWILVLLILLCTLGFIGFLLFQSRR